MLVLTIVSIAIVSTGVISGSSVLLCRSRAEKEAPLLPPLRFTVIRPSSGQKVTVLAAFNNKTVCEFQHSTSHRIVNNLYRVFGSVALARSEKEVAILYRNTVGNGGYIEFWSHDFQKQSVLQSLLSRWQRRGDEQDDRPPLRIYISSKLVAGTCELEVHNSSTRYIWSDGMLYKVDGSSKRLAAKIEEPDSRTTLKYDTSHLLVYQEVINPYLAVCTMLFFMLQPKHRKSY